MSVYVATRFSLWFVWFLQQETDSSCSHWYIGKAPLYVPLSNERHFAFHTTCFFSFFFHLSVRARGGSWGTALFLLSSGSVLVYTCLLAWLIGMHLLLFIVSPEHQREPRTAWGVHTDWFWDGIRRTVFTIQLTAMEGKMSTESKRLCYERGGASSLITKRN